MAKQSQASIKRSIKNLRLIIDGENVDPVTKRMAYFAENTLRWAIEDTTDWQRPEVDLEDEVALLLKEAAEHGVQWTWLIALSGQVAHFNAHATNASR